ncbi:hypothetical protein AVEN_222546-1 [Araneus ventricosus]|uniref:Uncharacterized protein n=1 Tax=Araneus ventricosus TaxID=182803 RepID=A0A4Y2GYW4_ARAVE|nr:hypothetical protein AVEN_222546-1 [Araneus ventricosus]
MDRGAELASFFCYSVLPLLHRKASFGILLLQAHSGMIYQQAGGDLPRLMFGEDLALASYLTEFFSCRLCVAILPFNRSMILLASFFRGTGKWERMLSGRRLLTRISSIGVSLPLISQSSMEDSVLLSAVCQY